MALRIQDLYTFHVVARTGAMQDAAHELGVTPSAISQRIRAVEARHGLRLFTRSKNGIALTKAGRALAADIGAAFATIETAHTEHFNARHGDIRMSTSATFAYARLVSSLGRFSALHPKIKVSVETDDRVVDLKSEPIDLAIRHGLGGYAGVVSTWLCAPELMLVGSPALLEKHGALTAPADCLRYTLLPDAGGKDWQIWLEAQGLDPRSATYGTHYSNDFLAVKAATEGQGLALLSDVYVKDSLETGQLVRALNVAWPSTFAYYAVARKEVLERPAIAALVAWLKVDLA